MQTVRWGIAGPGAIANKFAVAVNNVEGSCLTSVASRSFDRAEDFASRHSIENIFGSYEEMAASEEVDAVYISTIHPFHRECAELFMKKGKHILCEKPLCINAEDARYLRDRARENGVFLMEAMWTRFLPAIKEAVSVAMSGAIGELRGARADFCYSTTPQEEEKLFLNEMAGGSLLDVGVYGLHLASMLFGSNPCSIDATAIVENGVDCHTVATLRYDEGRIATVSSAINLLKPEDAYIYGSRGYIRIPTFYGAREFFVTSDGKTENYCFPPMADGFEEEIAEVCQCIRLGKSISDTLPPEQTIAILKIMDKIREIIGVSYPGDK